MQNYKHLTVDLNNCYKEPIHIIGLIQPHGFLTVLNKSTLQIEQVSENAAQFLDTDPADLLGNSYKSLCFEDEARHLENQLLHNTNVNPKLIYLKGSPFFGFLYESLDKLILECEPYAPQREEEHLRHNCQLSKLQSDLNTRNSQSELANLIAEFVQSVLDYDRVMVYVFDQDWNGEVIAEKAKVGAHSYLHHHFPASDIPAPARDLLHKKPIRQIPDVLARAVEIVPYNNPTTGAPTNIIKSELRNPSEIHLEYLHNMGVSATLSVSIVVNEKLWGLITCHHNSSVFIDYWKRAMCSLAAKAYANAILSIQEKRDFQSFEEQKAVERALIEQVYRCGDIGKGLFEEELNLLQLTECTGAAMYLNGHLTLFRATPSEEQVMELIKWLSDIDSAFVFHTKELSRDFEPATSYRKTASGLLALEISRYNREYLLLFKPEIKEARIWAGNPDKLVIGEDQKIHPRKSFAKWEEVVKGKSLPWTQNELEISQLLLKDLIATKLQIQAAQLQRLNNNLLVTAEDLKGKNRRLEDFAHIIAHNLRSPMNNISGLYSVYQTSPTQETAVEVMERINTMTANMLETIEDLHAILRTTNDHGLPEQGEVALAEVIEKEAQNLASVIEETQAQVHIELSAPTVTVPKVYMESIVHNLFSNALKYRTENRSPIISIKSWVSNNLFHLSVADNGLGMDLNKVGNKLFGLYKTFHRNKDSKGLGLYLTKMQVDALGGDIDVQSELGKGTTFTFSCPQTRD